MGRRKSGAGFSELLFPALLYKTLSLTVPEAARTGDGRFSQTLLR